MPSLATSIQNASMPLTVPAARFQSARLDDAANPTGEWRSSESATASQLLGNPAWTLPACTCTSGEGLVADLIGWIENSEVEEGDCPGGTWAQPVRAPT